MSRVVKITLGPQGANVLLERGFGSPVFTKDGITVARGVQLADPFENMGAAVVRDVAAKINDVAGDGTTTATVLAEAIFTEGLRAVAGGIRSVYLNRGVERVVTHVVAELQRMSTPVKGNQQLANVAAIATNNDEVIGRHIAESLGQVGKDGVVTLDEDNTTQTEIQWVESMQFDRGCISPYFVTDPQKMECRLEDPFILLYEKKLSNVKDMIPLMEKCVQSGRPLLVIAEDVDTEPLTTLVLNRLRGTLKCAAVKASGYGDRRKLTLEGIGILTGGTAILAGLDVNIETIELEQPGTAKTVVIGKDNTTIIHGAGCNRCSD